jgi:TonB family protein
MQTYAATPLPVATQEACGANRDAILKSLVAPGLPDGARDLATGPKTVLIDVSVSPSGSVTGVKVTESSGNSSIDIAALDAALKSTYLPKIVSCKGVEGHYLLRAEFNPD